MRRKLAEENDIGSPDSDRVLVQACLKGDEAGWEALVRFHGRRIFNLCLRFTNRWEEAEDLTQEIFVRIYQNLKNFRADEGRFSSWIQSIARNLLIDDYRKRQGRRRHVGSEEMAALRLEDRKTLSPSQAMELAEFSRLLSQALIGLNPELRRAVILREFEGMSYHEVAQTTGVSEGTVKSRLFRARLHLARIFSGDAADGEVVPSIPLAASHGAGL
jgi:RNA polymerase sigma-70 factor (ECF subfamily)